jgi:predicted transcriptional regulator YheO
MAFLELMFVEDLISEFASKVKSKDDQSLLAEMLRADDWTKRFVQSVDKSVEAGRPLSTEQSRVFMNIVKRYHKKGIFNIMRNFDIDSFIASPRHRQQPYASTNVPKEVRYLGDNKLAFRSKWIDEIVNDIKSLSNKSKDYSWKEYQRPYWNSQGRFWVVSLTSDNYNSVMKIIADHDFHFDDAVAEYLALASNSRGEKATFVLDAESGNIIANVCDNEILESWIKRVLFGEIL